MGVDNPIPIFDRGRFFMGKRIPKRAACYSLNRSRSLSKPYLQQYRNLGKNECLEERDVYDEDMHDEDVHDEDLQKNRELKECERNGILVRLCLGS
jgi:hypothetical protein